MKLWDRIALGIIALALLVNAALLAMLLIEARKIERLIPAGCETYSPCAVQITNSAYSL